jgi:hypothetical protein
VPEFHGQRRFRHVEFVGNERSASRSLRMRQIAGCRHGRKVRDTLRLALFQIQRAHVDGECRARDADHEEAGRDDGDAAVAILRPAAQHGEEAHQ